MVEARECYSIKRCSRIDRFDSEGAMALINERLLRSRAIRRTEGASHKKGRGEIFVYENPTCPHIETPTGGLSHAASRTMMQALVDRRWCSCMTREHGEPWLTSRMNFASAMGENGRG